MSEEETPIEYFGQTNQPLPASTHTPWKKGRIQQTDKPRVGENVVFCTAGGDNLWAAIITRAHEDGSADLFVMAPMPYQSTRHLDRVRRSSKKDDGGTWRFIGEFE